MSELEPPYEYKVVKLRGDFVVQLGCFFEVIEKGATHGGGYVWVCHGQFPATVLGYVAAHQLRDALERQLAVLNEHARLALVYKPR